MRPPADDPLSRVLAALEQIRMASLDPVAEAACQTAQEALLEMQKERRALLGVTREAARLLTILDSYAAALKEGDQQRSAQLAEVGTEAEKALSEALSHISTSEERDTAVLVEAALRAALDRLSKNEGRQDSNNVVAFR